MTHSAFDTVTDDAPAASPSGRRPGLSPFYLEEPDIPEGVTCAEWRGRRRRDTKRGPLAYAPEAAVAPAQGGAVVRTEGARWTSAVDRPNQAIE